MLRFSKDVLRRRSVIDGSMGHDILVAADAGKLRHRECSALMIDYLVPSLDTTISGIANALALFAMHPDQWELLRAEPSLLPNAINEVLRYESPLRAFTRKLLQPTEIADIDIPAGSRVLVLYASANRDEQEWTHPDVFDIRRNATRHLGFGCEGTWRRSGRPDRRIFDRQPPSRIRQHHVAERCSVTQNG